MFILMCCTIVYFSDVEVYWNRRRIREFRRYSSVLSSALGQGRGQDYQLNAVCISKEIMLPICLFLIFSSPLAEFSFLDWLLRGLSSIVIWYPYISVPGDFFLVVYTGSWLFLTNPVEFNSCRVLNATEPCNNSNNLVITWGTTRCWNDMIFENPSCFSIHVFSLCALIFY